jgi:hypothetical protein
MENLSQGSRKALGSFKDEWQTASFKDPVRTAL